MSWSIDRELAMIVESATTESVREVFGTLFEEDERARQKNMVTRVKELSGNKANGTVDEADDDDKSTDKKSSEEKKGVIKPTEDEVVEADFQAVVDKVNILRSGKSLKDEDVRVALNDYFDQLQPGEQQALYVFLNSMSQIVSGGANEDEVVDPADVNINISGKRRKDDKGTSISRAAKKRPQAAGEPVQKKASMPIVVGESFKRNNRRLLVRVKKLMAS